MQMRMEEQLLVPGMEDGSAADAHAAMPGVLGDRTQRLGGGAEQDVKHDPTVAKGDGGNLHGQSEDHVEVGHRQDFGGARLAPAVGGKTLAGGAVAVAAGVVERMLTPAPVTAVHVSAERGGSACLDRSHDLEPAGVEPASRALTVSAAGAAEDLRHPSVVAIHATSAVKH